MARASRAYAGFKESKESEEPAVAKRALRAVCVSLDGREIRGAAWSGRDHLGLYVDVAVLPEDAEAARAWRDEFGRSYGPVRIFVREAE